MATVFGAHRAKRHSGEEFAVSAKNQEPKTAARKMRKRFWITAKNPKMSRKDEWLTHQLAVPLS